MIICFLFFLFFLSPVCLFHFPLFFYPFKMNVDGKLMTMMMMWDSESEKENMMNNVDTNKIW